MTDRIFPFPERRKDQVFIAKIFVPPKHTPAFGALYEAWCAAPRLVRILFLRKITGRKNWPALINETRAADVAALEEIL
jgi:hypothetical protein